MDRNAQTTAASGFQSIYLTKYTIFTEKRTGSFFFPQFFLDDINVNSLCYLKIVLPVSSKLPKISLCNSKTDFLENKMFYFSDITGFSEDAVKCHAQIMSQNFVLQPGT